MCADRQDMQPYSPFLPLNNILSEHKPCRLCALLLNLHQHWFNLGSKAIVAVRPHPVAPLPHFATSHRKLSLMNSISSTEEAGLPRATR
jgi:hypothetical protein